MSQIKIAIIGLGYVGLPLARLFATKYAVVGFDINSNRVKELNAGKDSTLEVEDEVLKAVLVDENSNNVGLYCSTTISDLEECNYYIITVPTPVDKNNRPILTPLIKASETVGSVLKKGDIVVYESTVYPGATEEDCIPVLEKTSGLQFNTDFFAGYSPERINPGDKLHTIEKILKVTSGSNVTTGKKDTNAIIMGRKTFESIGKPLKNRYNCVISTTLQPADYIDQCVYIYKTLNECLEDLHKKEHIIQIFVIGGAKLYEEALALPECHYLYVNSIIGNYDCDIFFPYFDKSKYNLEIFTISPRVTCNIYNKLK